MNEPNFDELVGSDLDTFERERLRRVHDALVAAGPPPDLSAGLAEPPELERQPVRLVFRRRRAAVIALAAAFAVVVFAAGFASGHRRAEHAPVAVISMSGTALASQASASLELYEVDTAGNWPMKLSVRGLGPSANGRPYELWLTRRGKLMALCGRFAAETDGTTTVPMNAPYRLKEYDGWVVVVEGSRSPVLTTA